jgi:hypothetical protein
LGAAGLVALGVVLSQDGWLGSKPDRPLPALAPPAPTLVSGPVVVSEAPPPVAPTDTAVFATAAEAPIAPEFPAPPVAPALEVAEAITPPASNSDPALDGTLALPEPRDDAPPRPAPDQAATVPPAPAPEPIALDLAMVPDDAALVVAARPSTLLARPELRSLYDLAIRSQPELRHYADLANLPGVEQVTLVVARHGVSVVGLENGASLFTAVGLIVRTSAPRDWKATAAAVAPGLVFDESRYAGRAYTRINLGEAGMSVGLYAPDDRTVVVAGLPNLYGFMAARDRPANPAWVDAWKALDGAEAAIALDVGTVRGQLEPLLMEAPGLVAAAGVLSPLWEETNGLVVGVSLTGGLAFDLVTTSPNEDQSQSVARTLEAVLTLARNSGRASKGVLNQIGQRTEEADAAVLLTVAEVANRLLDATQVERHGTVVRLRTATDQDLIRTARPWMKIGSVH